MLRLSVDYPAMLSTMRGEQQGRLANLSPKGAKLLLCSPPNAGTHGRLIIDTHEVYCRVAWNDDDACGLAFEHDLALEAVDTVLAQSQSTIVPVASTDQIPLGRKRGGSLISTADRMAAQAAAGERKARLNSLAGLFNLSP